MLRERDQLLWELAEVSRLLQDSTHEIDEAATKAMGINRTDGRCVDQLQIQGPMTAGELASVTGLSPAAITTMLDRMEKRGFVRRRRDDRDRRRVVVEATEQAHREAFALYAGLKDRGMAFLARFSDDEVRLINDYLREATRIQREQAAWIRDLDGQPPPPPPDWERPPTSSGTASRL